MAEREFKYILEIAECGSISKAAEKLFIAQPSLSQCLKKIEAEVGEQLFDRKKGGLSPTSAGEQYLNYARKSLSLTKDFNRIISDNGKNQIGGIQIGIPFTRGAYVLPKVLPEFKRKFPNIKVNVIEDNSANLSTMLEEGKIEIAFVNLPLLSDKFGYYPLYNERIALIVPFSHPLSQQYTNYKGIPVIDAHLVSKESFIFLVSGQRIRKFGERVFSEIGVTPNVILYLSNINTIEKLVCEGYGLAFVPHREDDYNYENQPFKYFYLNCNFDKFSIVISYNNEFYKSKAVQAFISTCREIFAANKSLPEGMDIEPD